MTEALTLVKRVYNPHIPKTFEDNRPWRDLKYKNVWQRDNKTGLLLLEKIYGQAIAEDFKNSKMIFNGPEYVLSEGSAYERDYIKDLKQI